MTVEEELLVRARAVLDAAPVIDGHNDLLYQLRDRANYDFDELDLAEHRPGLHTDIDRIRAGRLGGQFWSVYVPSDLPGNTAVAQTLEQIDALYEMVRRYPEVFELTRTADEVERASGRGRVASMIGVEGGQSIGCSLGALRMLARLGAGYMTLTHNDNTPWADSATDDPAHGGLTAFGEEVVREMNRLGILVDLAHVSPDTMRHAIEVSEAPTIFSHSNARALADYPRNVPDDVVERARDSGGVIMVSFVPGFLTPEGAASFWAGLTELKRLRAAHPGDRAAVEAGFKAWEEANPGPPATLSHVADHIDHLRDLAGVDHVGIGGDLDGTDRVAEGLDDVSRYPALFAELLSRGYTEDDLAKISRGNILRVMRQAEAVAERLRAERGPSRARIADLDGDTAPAGA
ncbi:MAG TPA: dipeptidase [Actinomycetota bacterium]|nr:dipeptidase [Actinomycetota bacterium]